MNRDIVEIVKDVAFIRYEMNVKTIDVLRQIYTTLDSCLNHQKYDTCMKNKYMDIHYKIANDWIPELIKYKQI